MDEFPAVRRNQMTGRSQIREPPRFDLASRVCPERVRTKNDCLVLLPSGMNGKETERLRAQMGWGLGYCKSSVGPRRAC